MTDQLSTPAPDRHPMGTEPQTPRPDTRYLRELAGKCRKWTVLFRPESDEVADALEDAEVQITRQALRAEQAETQLSSLRAEWAEERAVIFSDLRNLLDELGMFSGARPESPHEVMCAAIEEVHKLKQRVPGLPAAPGSLGEDDPGAIETGGE